MGCAICDQGSVQLSWDGKFSACFLISETSFAETPSALYLSNLSWKPSITVTKKNKSPFKEWRVAWPVWAESWGSIAEGWEIRKDAPDTCVVLRPTWGMTLDRYNIEPLLSSVTCLLHGCVSEDIKAYKLILVIIVSVFCFFRLLFYQEL